MSGTEQVILSALVFAVALLAGVLIPLAIRRLPADYLRQPGRSPNSETAVERGLRTAAGGLLVLAGVLLLARWPFRGLILSVCGLAAASYPGKHRLIRRLLRVELFREFVNGIRDAANLGALERAEGRSEGAKAASPELELDIHQELAKKLAAAAAQPDFSSEENERRTPIRLQTLAASLGESEPKERPSQSEERVETPDITNHSASLDARDPVRAVTNEELTLMEASDIGISADDAPTLRKRPDSVSVDSMTLSQASLASPYLRDPGGASSTFAFDPRASSRSGFHQGRSSVPPPRRSRTKSEGAAEHARSYVDGDPMFTAYLSVRWHCGSRPARGKNSVWWCAVERGRNGKVRHELKNPSTRVKALEQIGDIFSDWVARGVSGIACFDFPFGFPSGFGRAMGVRVPRWRGSWELVAGRVRDEQIGKKWNNRFEAADSLNKMLPGDGPFWGHPPNQEFTSLSRTAPEEPQLPGSRACDALSPDPRSVWRMAYGASSGGHALMGIPYVQHLSTAIELEESVSVWPFDVDSTKPFVSIRPRILLAEGHPGLVEPFDDPSQPADANRVRAFAEHLESLDSRGDLAPLLSVPDQLPAEVREDVVNEEGWVLGVPAPAPSHWESK